MSATHDDLQAILRDRIRVRGGASKLARDAGISHTLVSLTASGKIPMGMALANALGYVMRVNFVKIGGEG